MTPTPARPAGEAHPAGDGFVWRSLPLPDGAGAAEEPETGPESLAARPPELRALVCPAFPAPHAFTGRPISDDPPDTPLGAPDRQAADLHDLRRALEAGTIHAMRQVHGTVILPATAPTDRAAGDPPAEPECDGLFTLTPGEALAVKTADCVPLLLHDPLSGAAAAVHAGWRGAAGDLATRAVRALARATGSPPTEFHAALGPAIGPCCFEVGPEVLAAFAAGGRDPDQIRSPAPPPPVGPPKDPAGPASDRARLDLHRDTRLRLRAAGLRPDRIHATDACTRCGPDFHSYRREGRRAGRNWAAIRAVVRAIRPERPT